MYNKIHQLQYSTVAWICVLTQQGQSVTHASSSQRQTAHSAALSTCRHTGLEYRCRTKVPHSQNAGAGFYTRQASNH